MRNKWLVIALVVVVTHAVLGLTMWNINRGSHAVSREFQRVRPETHGGMTVRFAGFAWSSGLIYRYTITVDARFQFKATYVPTDDAAVIELRVPPTVNVDT